MESSKILILNPLVDKFASVLKKTNSINKSNGPFDAIFYLGDSIPKNLQEVEFRLDCPTYAFEGSESLKEVESSKVGNLKILPKNGVFTINELSVGYLSGADNEANIELFNDTKIDILFTYQWPHAFSKSHYLNATIFNESIDEIILKTQPKYIFSCGKKGGIHFESCFKWKESKSFTRFISLGEYKSDKRWFYAFNISKTSVPPTEFEENPFEMVDSKKRSSSEIEKEPKEKKRKIVAVEDCFFCLSNPKVETHMVISIGNESYLTIAKGPLTTPQKFKNKPISGHCLLIPINHISNVDPIQKFMKIDDNDLIKEFNKYQTSLKFFFEKEFEMGFCQFEINTKKSVHYHQQIIPINQFVSIKKFEKSLIFWQDKNNEKNENDTKSDLDFKIFKKLETGKYDEDELSKFFGDDNKEYVSIELSIKNLDNNKEKEDFLFVTLVDSSKYIDLQFPRKLLANFLNLKKRSFWNKCVQPKELESLETELFQKNYKPYDFTT